MSRASLCLSFLACASFAACSDSKSGSGSDGSSAQGGSGSGGSGGSGTGGSGTGGSIGSGGSGGAGGTGGGAGGSSGSGGSGGSAGSVDARVDTSSAGGADAARDSSGTTGDGGGNVSAMMSFFVTSKGSGKGGDFRATMADTDGLAGADALCTSLAMAVSPALGAKTWKAYLSTAMVNARDRIGMGPWRNAAGVVIAESVAQLHEEGNMKNNISGATALDERGAVVPGVMRPAGTSNVHDILTGTMVNGRAAPQTCDNWTSSAGNNVTGHVGHSDRMGGGSTNWNSVHNTASCSATGVTSGGGRGSIYCFATN